MKKIASRYPAARLSAADTLRITLARLPNPTGFLAWIRLPYARRAQIAADIDADKTTVGAVIDKLEHGEIDNAPTTRETRHSTETL